MKQTNLTNNQIKSWMLNRGRKAKFDGEPLKSPSASLPSLRHLIEGTDEPNTASSPVPIVPEQKSVDSVSDSDSDIEFLGSSLDANTSQTGTPRVTVTPVMPSRNFDRPSTSARAQPFPPLYPTSELGFANKRIPDMQALARGSSTGPSVVLSVPTFSTAQ